MQCVVSVRVSNGTTMPYSPTSCARLGRALESGYGLGQNSFACIEDELEYLLAAAPGPWLGRGGGGADGGTEGSLAGLLAPDAPAAAALTVGPGGGLGWAWGGLGWSGVAWAWGGV